VRSLSLGGATDETLWSYEVFLSLSVRRGVPPKVICLAIGNVSHAVTAECLLCHAKEIKRFVSHPEAGFLLLGLKPTPERGRAMGSLLHLHFRMAPHRTPSASARATGMATASSTMGLASTGARAPNRPAPPSLLVEKRGGRHNLSIRLDVREGQKSMVVSQQVGWMATVIGSNEEHTWRF